MTKIRWIILLSVGMVVATTAYIVAGLYPIGADVPHNRVSYWLLETLRERAIARASSDLEVPDLSSPELLLAGGPDYNEMCAQCHLKPGRQHSDMSIGLYPSPPNLSLAAKDPARREGADIITHTRHQFWVIKHGIKASGMPAWGATHDDQRIWAMVAFLQKLPTLTPEQYQILTARTAKKSDPH